jgi:hypothetical protein
MGKEEAKHIATHLYCQAKSLAKIVRTGVRIVLFRVI